MVGGRAFLAVAQQPAGRGRRTRHIAARCLDSSVRLKGVFPPSPPPARFAPVRDVCACAERAAANCGGSFRIDYTCMEASIVSTSGALFGPGCTHVARLGRAEVLNRMRCLPRPRADSLHGLQPYGERGPGVPGPA